VETGDIVNGLQKRCFKSLCAICATRGVLPTPYTLDLNDLQRSEVPGYKGGFGVVSRGMYNEKPVAIKRLLMNAGGQPLEKIKEVRPLAGLVHANG
jgi:hypothetical protein